MARKDDWDLRYESWKANRQKKFAQANSKPASSTAPAISPSPKPAPVEHKEPVKDVPTRRIQENSSKWPVILAFLIPLLILGYVLYINFLPLGFNKTYSLNVASDATILTSSNNIYLTDLKGNKIESLEEVYGTIYLNVEPRRNLKNAIANISITGTNVYLATPIDFDPSSVSWDNNFDFSQGVPSSLKGNAVYDSERSCTYFGGNSSLYLPNSQDQFEVGPFTVYAEWTPEDSKNNFQQIVGHYNWELVQNNNSVRFQIGRVNAPNQTLKNLTGATYTVTMPVNESFFGNAHEVLTIYDPSDKGYIELWVDNQFGGRAVINDSTIWADYNQDKPLSVANSQHGAATYFTGCMKQVKFNSGLVELAAKRAQIVTSSNIKIPIIGKGRLEAVTVSLNQ